VGYELICTTADGSCTLYSDKFQQHYHNRKDGAFYESITKHISPAFTHLNNLQNIKEINILDICFGLGYNTLCTLYYIQQQNLNIKINIYSPEIDKRLLKTLVDFPYPDQLQPYKHIIKKLSCDFYYHSSDFNIEIFVGDAREYLKKLIDQSICFHIVYQDAFSSDVNSKLWSVEYFGDIYKLLCEDGIITTYSVATPVRLSMYQNNFLIYENVLPNNKKQTLAFKKPNQNYQQIDMKLKQKRNPKAKAIYDKNLFIN
jgi:tRNA U34 5-methylaminomethyl-2-thiouridine-forming methyltransferase MnmC